MSADRCDQAYPARPDGTGIGCPRCRGLAEARTERDQGLAATVSRPAGTWDRNVVLNVIKHLAESGEPFTADQVTPLLPEVGRQTIGAAFNTARRRGLIEACGFRQSTNPTRHASVVRIWRGTTQTSGPQQGGPAVAQPER